MLSIAIVGAAVYGSFSVVRYTATLVAGVTFFGLRQRNKRYERDFKNGVNPEVMRINPLESFYNITFTKEELPIGFEFLIGNWCLTESEFMMLHWGIELKIPDSEYFQQFVAELRMFSKNRLEDPIIQGAMTLAQKKT